MPKPSQPLPSESSPEIDAAERARSMSGAVIETVSPRARRSFPAGEKLRIVRAAEACLASGVRGALEALLRKEGIYGSQLSAWRQQLNTGGEDGLVPSKPGRKSKRDAKDVLIAAQAKRIAELERKAHVAGVLIDLQKKRTSFWVSLYPPAKG